MFCISAQRYKKNRTHANKNAYECNFFSRAKLASTGHCALACPGVAIEGAIGDGLEEVVFLDIGGAIEVGDGAGDFEDTIVGAGGHYWSATPNGAEYVWYLYIDNGSVNHSIGLSKPCFSLSVRLVRQL